MLKGFGTVLSTTRGEREKTFSIPVVFSSPIYPEEWVLVQRAVNARLCASPIQVIIPGNFEKQFKVVFNSNE